LFNADDLWDATSESTHRQQDRAGYRSGDGERIDLLRYTTWLSRDRRQAPPPAGIYAGTRDGE